ncbi:integrase [Bacteroides heparinolyticus]|uniref:Integrase n=1 Tax=Prevotella heparinolytica TaxID=28113 RepID=A0A449I0P3_9BACE|nr:integrase [Bacteroides heparinolyticus]
MFNFSFHFPKGCFAWVHRSVRPYSGETGKAGGPEESIQPVKTGESHDTDTADNPYRGGIGNRAGGTGRPSPLLSGFVAVAARGVSSSTAGNYRTAVRSFILFNGGRDLPLSSLNADAVRRYERWLHGRGVCPNTSSCYLRSLRALYNKAASKRLVKDRAPFRGVFTGNEKTVKRSIGAQEIRRLRTMTFPDTERPGDSMPVPKERRKRKERLLSRTPPSRHNSWLEHVRDLFLFSFYAMGMPFVDMAHLRRSQIKDGMLVYHRQKTGRQVRVMLEPCMLDILARYEAEGSDYLFPILYKLEDGRPHPVSYSCALRRYNRSLKLLARRAGVPAGLTSYTARHSWASIAYAGNVDLPVISKALGHSDSRTTLVYIEEIKEERLMRANRKLLKGIGV